ncbi:MAG TPA: alpha/beta fold hydrolase [Streptosporangiaceae bacterium]|nr:alpha/beta fold hydrolase [Streptosporangiaceae bacterium]
MRRSPLSLRVGALISLVVLGSVAGPSLSASAGGPAGGWHEAARSRRPLQAGMAPRIVARRDAAAALGTVPGAVDRRHPIRVGSVLIPPCRASRLAWCTTIRVPYDYFQPAAGTIRLGFQWYPATSGKSSRTIVAIQGGPGYPTTDYADSYRAMFGPLLTTRNLLLVNLRGTGNSSPFTCKALQDWTLRDSIASYTADTGACGRQLNHTRKLIGSHRYVQASDLYTTANAARDLAFLLRRLRTGRVDLYGDSYGTFFSQAFTARYHEMLRSVTLDSAYPVAEANPFYPLMIPAAREAFDLSCARSLACGRAAPGGSWARIGLAARYLRVHPVTGRTRDPYGAVRTTHVGVFELIELVNLAGADSGVYRELDPAIRALLGRHDPAPLLRLTAQEIDPTATSGPVRSFNDGLYEATSCLDYPQPFSYRSSAPQRRAEYAKAVARLAPSAFAPFTVREWVTEPQEEFDACLDWPAPARPDPPITTPAPYAPRSLPVLMLSGDLDSLTTPAEGRWTAREMGPSARWILFRNDTHINAMDDTFGCAQGLVRQFIADPARLRALNASCARHTPEVRVVGNFARRLSGVAPASPRSGNQAGPEGLRLAAVAVTVVGDADWHWYYGDGVHGWGLRGGTYRFAGPASRTRITFIRYRWTSDTAVSGYALWDQVTGRMRAWLTVTAPDGRTATVRFSYRDYVFHAFAAISGRFAGRVIAAILPAP